MISVQMIVQAKEKLLRKLKIEAGQLAMRPEDMENLEGDDEDLQPEPEGRSEVTSVVEMQSDCGTNVSGTEISNFSRGGSGIPPIAPIGVSTTDVANLTSLAE